MVYGKTAQAGIGPILVVVGIISLVLAFTIMSLLSPITNEFIQMGVNSSEAHNDSFTGFVIKLIPIWLVIVFLGMLVYIIATGGGG